MFTAVNIAVGLAIGYIPGIEHVFLFGNTIPNGAAPAGATSDNIFVSKGVYVIPFWFNPHVVGDAGERIYNMSSDPFKALTLFIYAFVYGLGAGVCYSILYIIGGCSGGGDFISIYRSSIKHKPLGGVMIMINSICLITGSIIGSYIPAGMINPQGYHFEFFLSSNLVASFLSVVIMGFLLNR
ncbi:hypothetical protein FACS1894166_03620 [Bacilli bacterium]|nr:hypothetical protein FACS1894166_03620 [Bacilli bacterium]